MRLIEVVNYSESWPVQYEQEKKLILAALVEIEVTLHHIGSTSVIGLAAKPIIDILMELEDITELDSYNSRMAEIGFTAKGEFGIAGRRYFQKGDRSHHLHAFGKGDPGLHRHLAFRDYLRAHPTVCEEYAELKKRIASQCDHDAQVYCDGKDDFVSTHEQKALDWIAKS